MVVLAVDISRRMMELRGTSLQCGRRTLLSQQCNSISGMARLTSRQGHLRRSGLNAIATHAAAPAFGLNSSPVLSIVCIITASLRATVTAALLKPIDAVQQHLFVDVQLYDMVQFDPLGMKQIIERNCLRDRTRKSIRSRRLQQNYSHRFTP
jgi:hypothetical protein